MKRIAVLDDYQGVVLSLPYWARLSGRARVDAYRDTAADEDALAERLRPYQIVVPIRERTAFRSSLLSKLPALELIALTGRNSGHLDLQAATARGILVSETEGSGSSAIEHTMALLLAVVRRIPQDDRAMKAGGWQTGMATELSGKVLGIVGLGRIGSRIAAFGKFLGMRVLAWSPNLDDQRAAAVGVRHVSLEELFRESDVVSLHLRLSDRTRHIVRTEQLSLMKPTAYLINTARGPLVDEEALVAALKDKRLAGAALDVYGLEPLPTAHPLRSCENAVLTPHMGFVTREAYELFFSQAVEAIDSYLQGKLPTRALNPQVMSGRAARLT